MLKAPESSLDSREIKPVNLKGVQSWILIWRTDIEVETPVFWSSDANSQTHWKVLDIGEHWGQKEKRASEDEMTGWHHQCNGQTLGDGEGQGRLACCSLWGCKASDTTGWLNNSNYTLFSTIAKLQILFQSHRVLYYIHFFFFCRNAALRNKIYALEPPPSLVLKLFHHLKEIPLH